MSFIIKDSGKRTKYKGGAVRDLEDDKIMWDLLPLEALKRVAIHYTNGAIKYERNNWKKGVPIERFERSALRHLIQYLLGEKDEDHLSATIFNVLGIIYNEEINNKNMKKGTPKKDGSGKGTRANKGRGGCRTPQKTGKGK